jgi:hypothetical protein
MRAVVVRWADGKVRSHHESELTIVYQAVSKIRLQHILQGTIIPQKQETD